METTYAKVDQVIAARRLALGETVWAHIGTERRNMIAVEACARLHVNYSLYIQWRMKQATA